MRMANTIILANALSRALAEHAKPASGAPSVAQPAHSLQEDTMNDQAPTTDATSATTAAAAAPAAADHTAVPVQGDGGAAAGGDGAAAPVAPAAPAVPAAGGAGNDGQTSWLVDYGPVLLAVTSGLLKTISAFEEKEAADGSVDPLSLDMLGNYLTIMSVLAEAYRRNVRRTNEQGGAGYRA